MIKDCEEILQKRIQICRCLCLVGRICSVRKSRSDGMLDIQDSGSFRPRVWIHVQFGVRLETTISSGMQRLRDGRVLHHDSAVETTTTGSAVQPENHGVGYFLRRWFKEPKHGLQIDAVVMIGGQHASVHVTVELGVGGLDLFQALYEELLFRSKVHCACAE